MDSTKLLIDEINSNRHNKLKILRLHNKILEAKLDYLNALKQHYNDHWLDFDTKCSDLRAECQLNKVMFKTYQSSSKKLLEINNALRSEAKILDGKISNAEKRVIQFKELDHNLLAEYQRLKDDLECQDLLIEISETQKFVN